jgi:hypothetical protein
MYTVIIVFHKICCVSIQCICFLWMSQQTTIIFLYHIKHLDCIMENYYVLCEVGTEIFNVMCTSFLRYSFLNIFWVVNIHLKFNFFPQSQFCREVSSILRLTKRHCFWHMIIPVGLCVRSIHSTNFPVFLNRSTCQPGWHLRHSVISPPSLSVCVIVSNRPALFPSFPQFFSIIFCTPAVPSPPFYF